MNLKGRRCTRTVSRDPGQLARKLPERDFIPSDVINVIVHHSLCSLVGGSSSSSSQLGDIFRDWLIEVVIANFHQERPNAEDFRHAGHTEHRVPTDFRHTYIVVWRVIPLVQGLFVVR